MQTSQNFAQTQPPFIFTCNVADKDERAPVCGGQACPSGCLTKAGLSDIPRLPLAQINVQFHFVRSLNNNFNFQCSDPSAPYYATQYAQQILNQANLLFSNPLPNAFGNSVDLPDARIRYVFYGEASDPCSIGVLVHNDASEINFIPGALHVVFSGDACSLSGGASCPASKIDISGLHCWVFNQGATDVSPFGGLLNHEVGHAFSLCHAFTPSNVCPDMVPADECAGPAVTTCANGEPCPANVSLSCGGFSPAGCFECRCTWGNGNNFMGYNGSLGGMTIHQWAKMYNEILNQMQPYVKIIYDCETPPPGTPSLVIPSNTYEHWEGLRIIDQPVEVMPNATLKISCEVRMAPGQPIIVHRGGRLYVHGGLITSQGEFQKCRWGGIFVHGNANQNQPDIAVAKDRFTPLPATGAGVVWLNGATLRNAPTAISTKFSSDYDPSDYWGGLVIAEYSDFINNGRAVEFMKYEPTNKSYFDVCDIFKEGNPEWSVNRGISMWACRGISLNEVHFEDISTYALQLGNATATMTNSSVKKSDRGVDANYTMANVELSKNRFENNLFQNTRAGIWSNASPNMIYPFTITNNDFLRNTSGTWGVRFNGESRYVIHDNDFYGFTVCTHLISTGNATNYVKCNNYALTQSDPPASYGFGIYGQFNNSGLYFVGNTFAATGNRDVDIIGTSTNKGKVRPIQEYNGKSAGNCFDNPNQPIFAVQGETELFDYKVFNLNNNPVFCERPTNNQSDGGVNNYLLKPVDVQMNRLTDCGLDPEGGPKSGEGKTEADLTAARLLAEQHKAALAADPDNASAKQAYYQATTQQGQILQALLKTAADAQDYAKLETLLLGEGDNKARREVVGLRMLQKNYGGAQALLDAMPVTEADDQRYKDLMQVNLALAQSPNLYQPTAAQEAMLMDIANTPHSLMSGYACALLSICKGYVCEDGLPEGLGGQETEARKVAQPTAAATDDIKVFPNPATQEMHVNCPLLVGELLTLELYDLSGKLAFSSTFRNSGQFSMPVGSLSNGAYHLRLFHSRQMLKNTKVFISR